MQGELGAAVVWIAIIALAIFFFSRLTTKNDAGGSTRGSRVGPGASGTIYDWLNQDKRNAIELIVEEKAAARDPEDKDGNLPDLANPRKPT